MSTKEKSNTSEAIQHNLVSPKTSICGKCRAMGFPPPCKGHGGGGGGGSDSGSDDDVEKADSKSTADTSETTQINESISAPINHDSSQHFLLFYSNNRVVVNFDVISELLSKLLLSIVNNSKKGILSIECKPDLLTKDQNKELKLFIKAILNKLDEFKIENSISDNCVSMKTDAKGNFKSLRITLPTPTIYDAFIQQLVSENLLPLQSIEKQENVVYQQGINHFKNPFSMTPTPSMKYNQPDENEINGEIKNSTSRRTSPFNINGPKPFDC